MAEALIVVDLQNDFCPGGALGVAGGDEIVQPVNQILRDFDAVVLTQDWHPADHASFASQHDGKSPFETVGMPYGEQTLWPDHCVIGSRGAQFHSRLDTRQADLIVRKGFRREVDSYSAFFENDHETRTGLDGYLRERGIERVTLVGLATDYCVAFSALDAARLGYRVTVREDLCRAIDLDGSLEKARARLRDAGVCLA